MPQNVRLALARVFYILSGDAAVSAFIPFHCHDHALSTCDAFIEGVTLDAIHSKEEMAEDCPELAQFISACEGTVFLPLVLNVTWYHLSEKVMPMIHPVIQLIPSLVYMIQKVGLNTILLTTDAVYMKCLNMT